MSRSSPALLTPSRPSSAAWPLFTPQLSAGTGSFGVKNRRLQPPNDPSQLAPSQRQQDNGRCEGGATARRSEVKEKAHVVNFASVLLFPNPVTFASESAQNTQGHECKKPTAVLFRQQMIHRHLRNKKNPKNPLSRLLLQTPCNRLQDRTGESFLF